MASKLYELTFFLIGLLFGVSGAYVLFQNALAGVLLLFVALFFLFLSREAQKLS